ncbi:MAG: S8 family serine peptidase, partial [Methanosarcinales archaeon]
MANESLGNYFWRGGKKIELQKTEDSFTTIIGKNSDLDRVKEIPGVSSVKKLYGNITELKIDPKERDNLMDKIRSDEVGLICHHEYVSKESPTTKFTLTDEIIVKFKPEVSSSEILKIVEDIGVMIKKQYSDEPNSYLLKVTSKANANPIKVANKLVESNKVEYAEANLINVFQPYYKPRDSLFKDQWHLSYVWGIDIAENADIMASEAWEITKGSREIAVAILDDGVDLDHPDFKGEGKIMFPKDFVDGDIRPFPEKEYGDYHGTACAGVAVAEENGIGTVGGAHRCALMPVRFALSSTDNQLIEIFDYISQRANVLSCSWGPAPVNAPLNTKVYNKIHQITTTGGKNKKGLVIIFAAGNYNAPLNLVFNSFIWYDWNSKVPKKVTIGKICNGFAVHPDVIAVSACTSLNKKAAYSNWGKEISVTAPS